MASYLWVLAALSLVGIHALGLWIGRRRQVRELERAQRYNDQALQYQKSFVAAAIESLPGIFYLYDYPSLKLVWWNKNHETALGYSHEELVGKTIFAWHVAQSRDAIIAAVEDAMRVGTNSLETRLLAKDGSTIPFLLTGTKFEAEGKTYLMGVGLDISERLAAENKLMELNAKLESRVAERTRNLKESNEALEEAMRELKASQARAMVQDKMAALGQLIAGLAHELNTPLGAILSSCDSEKEYVADLQRILDFYRGLDDTGAAAFKDLYSECADRPSLIGPEDRAARKRIAGILIGAGARDGKALAERLSDAGYARGDDALATLSRTPRFREIVEATHAITAIGRSAYIIKTAADKAAGVVRALRNYSRHEDAPTMVIDRLEDQIATILTLLHNKLKHGVQVSLSYGQVPPVRCNPELLGQVWMNLITNAVQAMNYRGKLGIVIELSLDGKFVSVSILDDGPGVPKELAGRIFEPFFTTKAPGEGLGLGLDVCKKILESQGATIAFESEPGRTKFTVLVPIGAGERP